MIPVKKSAVCKCQEKKVLSILVEQWIVNHQAQMNFDHKEIS